MIIMNENKKIACLDTDVIIKMTHNESELLNLVVDIFDKCYIHDYIYKEVDWPEETVNILNKLIEKDKVNIINDEMLYNNLEIKRIFLDTLQQVCDIFGIDYDEIYSDIEQFKSNDKKFIKELKEADKHIKYNLGEIRTLLMIILLREIKQDKINYFISDDRRARNAVILKYGKTLTEQKIYGISLISSIHLLKIEGYAKARVLKVVENLQTKKNKIYYEKDRMDKMSNKQIINKLYANELSILKNGDFIIRK